MTCGVIAPQYVRLTAQGRYARVVPFAEDSRLISVACAKALAANTLKFRNVSSLKQRLLRHWCARLLGVANTMRRGNCEPPNEFGVCLLRNGSEPNPDNTQIPLHLKQPAARPMSTATWN